VSSLHVLDPHPSGRPAVLLLHGLGADGGSWALQLPALEAAGFRPLAPDTPGFGASPYDRQGWTVRRVAAGMARLLEELGTGPAHVVGLSMGGVIAQQLALDFPPAVRKLVLVSTFAALRPETLDGWWYFLRRATAVLLGGNRAQAPLVAERVFPGVGNEILRRMLIESIAKADPRAYKAAMRSLGLFDSRKRLGRLRVPALVISGEQDTTVSPVRQRQLVQAIPGARQACLPAAGHAVPVDQPEAFNRLLLDFLID